MTITAYRTSGKLTEPVSDLQAAREYLDEPMENFIYPEALKAVVFRARWDLTDTDSWKVEVITHRPLTDTESAALSEWISGQNSDGLGEGFEQQEFAEHCERDAYGDWDDDTYQMSSFDWQTNNCILEVVK